jgi:hypothetical protein
MVIFGLPSIRFRFFRDAVPNIFTDGKRTSTRSLKDSVKCFVLLSDRTRAKIVSTFDTCRQVVAHANWPINGEIDIVEGVNFQSEAKTALNSTKGCSMNDIPLDVMTGTWDPAQGFPDAKTGIPDMTLRYARDCFVYDPHQWLNQGCVAVSKNNESLGDPVNKNGGGVYALEWNPTNRHIRTWVFTPHSSARQFSRCHLDGDRVAPNPSLWPALYG